jgi:hypothetical protein
VFILSPLYVVVGTDRISDSIIDLITDPGQPMRTTCPWLAIFLGT